MGENIKKVQLSIIREQGEYMEPVALTAEENATVANSDNDNTDTE